MIHRSEPRNWFIVLLVTYVSLVIVRPVLSARRYPSRNVDRFYDQRTAATENRPHQSSSSSHSPFSSFYGFSGLLPPIQCYSCMSGIYEQYWTDMKEVYRKQDITTNRCDEPFFSRGMPYVNCSNICVTMKETIHIAGIRTVTAYIRGCLDKTLASKYRFNETALITYNFYRRDHCRELPRSLLIGQGLTDNVMFCACYGNRCNNAATVIPGNERRLLWFFLLRLLDHIRWTRSLFVDDDYIPSWFILGGSALFHVVIAKLMRRIQLI